MVYGVDMNTYVVLPDIRSVHNVGSIFRTSDAAGVSRVFLTGHTPAPIDRFGRARADIAKVALGAEKTVPWEYVADTKTLIQRLRAEGVRIVAVEQHERSVDYRHIALPTGGAVAFIFGNEVTGIPEDILSLCDDIAEIAMHGTKESLNVSVAVGVVLFGLLP